MNTKGLSRALRKKDKREARKLVRLCGPGRPAAIRAKVREWAMSDCRLSVDEFVVAEFRRERGGR